MRGELLDDIIGAIYDAPVSVLSGTDAWTAAVQRIEAASGGACLLSWQDDASGLATIAAPSLAPEFRRTYESGHATTSPWVQALRRLPESSTVTDAEITPAADEPPAGDGFYKCWMEPQRFHHGVASDVMRERSCMVVLKTLLPAGTPPTEDHIALHKALQPHLRRAATLWQQMHRRQAEAGIGKTVLEQLSVAAFLADVDGRVTFMNESARALIAANDGLALDPRECLVTSGSGRANHIHDLWRPRRGGSGRDEPAPRSIAMPVRRPSGKPDLHLMVLPPQDPPFGPTAPHVTIFVRDPLRPVQLSQDRLTALYGLTRREAEVAARLAQGATIRDIGTEMGVTESTIRWYTRCAFDKTETRRQADLVRLVLVNPLIYDSPDENA